MTDREHLMRSIPTWTQNGFAVLPAQPTGEKRPIGAWRAVSKGSRPAPDADFTITAIAEGRSDGICILMGECSGFAEMVEAEGRAIARMPEVAAAAERGGCSDLLERLLAGCVVNTPGGGVHHILRTTGPSLGNTKLALGSDALTLSETRGEGGLIIGPGSFGRTHPSGKSWKLVCGGPDTVPTFTPAERDSLYACFRTLHDYHAPAGGNQPAASTLKPTTSAAAVGNLFNAAVSWEDILLPLGWTKADHQESFTDDAGKVWKVDVWSRPDKPKGVKSATTGYARDTLIAWSSSAGITNVDCRGKYAGLKKFTVWTQLRHKGDFTKACGFVHAGLAAGLQLKEIARGARPLISVSKRFGKTVLRLSVTKSSTASNR